MRLLPDFTLRSSLAGRFLPAGRFFLRLVPLAPDLPALAQVELTLEGLAPFPPSQLYWGCCVSPDRTQALVYAAHRRRFSGEETADWPAADLAVPDLLPLLGAAPAGPAVQVLVTEGGLAGAAWAAGAAWPVAVLARAGDVPPTGQERAQFAAELAARAGVPGAPVTFLAGAPGVRREADRLIFELISPAGSVEAATIVSREEQDALDVRDRAFLHQRRSDRRRGELVWRLFLGGVMAAGLAALLDAGALASRLYDRALHVRLAAQADVVARLETAHGLATRVDELVHRRLHFFEMLAAINGARPRSIQFTRTATAGRNGLEIEGQTAQADDIGSYETSLRKLAELERVEVRDLRARDGITTFGLTLAFKPETGGAP